MKFSDIIGQDNTINRLKAMRRSGHIPHAILFEGEQGIGKMMLARAFAQYIHCTNPTADGDACGECPSCRQHQSYNHIDTIYVYPVVKGKSGKALSDDYSNDWHEFLNDSPWMDFEEWQTRLGNTNSRPSIYVEESQELIHKLNFTAHASHFKIVIIWQPERMNIECANKLLKIIEEPFEDTIFLLVSDNSREIIPTIYSRCQRISLRRLPDADVAEYLTTHVGIDEEEANAVAHIAEGSVTKALRAISANSEQKRYLQYFISLMRLAYQRNVKALKEWCFDIAKLSREQQLSFISYCQRMIRENFILNLNQPQLNYLSADEAAFSSRFHPFINEKNVIKLAEITDRVAEDISGNANSKIVFFDYAIKVILLIKQ